MRALKSIFRTHRMPKIIGFDNGLLFSSRVLQKFSEEYEFKHPYYPKSNGQAEHSVQTIKGLILKAISPKQNLPAPSCLLLGRKLRIHST